MVAQQLDKKQRVDGKGEETGGKDYVYEISAPLKYFRPLCSKVL
jgi:hypothetical protein